MDSSAQPFLNYWRYAKRLLSNQARKEDAKGRK